MLEKRPQHWLVGCVLWHINLCSLLNAKSCLYIYIIILIIITMLCSQHRYPWPSLATPPYCPLLPAGLKGYIPNRHRAAVCRFELVILSLWRCPQEYITYELIPTSPAVSCMSDSSNFDSFHDGWLVAIKLLLCEILSPGLVQYYIKYIWLVNE